MDVLATLNLGPSRVVLRRDIAATMQLSFIPGLARRGGLRAQIEAVRVHAAYRSRGLGAALPPTKE
jgi:ribosomal protein S18 acetylase RimI-like enzyme